jgi:hypothetical protein
MAVFHLDQRSRMLTLLSDVVDGATDIVEVIQQVLRASDEPLTPTRIHTALPPGPRIPSLEVVIDALERQVAAQVLVLFPRYRSRQNRYWDRPLRVHVEHLLRKNLRDGPMTRSVLRRRLPAYARILADSVLDGLIAQRRVYEHPTASRRTGPRLALHPADPRAHLRPELDALFSRLQRLGYRRGQLRDAALTILHEEAWDEPPREPVRAFGPRYAGAPREDLLTSV